MDNPQRGRPEFRKLPIISRRQVVTYFADLRLDKMIIIEQPFSSGNDAASAFEFCSARAIGVEQDNSVVVKPALKRYDARRPLGYKLRGRKTFSVSF